MPRRSKSEIATILDRIATIVQESPEGLSGPEVQESYTASYGDELPIRSLRRWLKTLGEKGRIRLEGEKRHRQYLPPVRAGSGAAIESGRGLADPSTAPGSPGGVIPLSKEGEELQRLIRRPKAKREPVSYNRAFLDEYDVESPDTWYLPLEIREELRQIGQTPEPDRPAGTYARDILEPLLIDLSWSSSRLEGNTYSRADTEELIKDGKEADGKDRKETQMILNHKRAIEFLIKKVEQLRFDPFMVRTVQAELGANLMKRSDREGMLRTGPVGISDSVYTPTAIPQMIDECFQLMLEKARAIPDPFEQAFFVLAHLPYLQPFWDVNKRTARIAANLPLFKENLVPLSFLDVPRDEYLEAMLAIYELNRPELLRDIFAWTYRRSCKQHQAIRESLGDPQPEPDPIRLRYGDELGDAVRSTVRAGRPPRRGALRDLGEESDVARDDLEDFADRAIELLQNLNEGSAGRYGITPEDLEAWREEVSGHV